MIGLSRTSFKGLAPTSDDVTVALPTLTGVKVSRLDAARADVNVKRMARLIDARGALYLIEHDEDRGVSIYQRGNEVGYIYDQDLRNGGFAIDESFVPDNLTEAIG